jgi:hypothetical protein
MFGQTTKSNDQKSQNRPDVAKMAECGSQILTKWIKDMEVKGHTAGKKVEEYKKLISKHKPLPLFRFG